MARMERRARYGQWSRSLCCAAAVLAIALPQTLQAASSAASSAKPGFSPVTFKTGDGGTIDGSFFKAKGPLAVVFAHGAVFNKESWYPLASRLAKAGIAALPFDFRGYGASRAGRDGRNARYQDVLGAIRFLESRGFKQIALVGGSMGGAAVLVALAHSEDAAIVKALLLAPAGGPPVKQGTIEKLFVVSKGDRLHPRVAKIYEESALPKSMVVLPGSAHAQNIFATAEGPRLTDLILRFLSAAAPGH